MRGKDRARSLTDLDRAGRRRGTSSIPPSRFVREAVARRLREQEVEILTRFGWTPPGWRR